MPPEAARWGPLACALLACYALWSMARTAPLSEEKAPPLKLALPIPPSDYTVPADISDPFRSPVVIGGGTGKAGGKAGAPGQKKPAGPPPVVIGGIIWNESSPMAIINGRTMVEGEKSGNFEVISIQPNSVTLRIGRNIVTKTIRLPTNPK